MGFLQLPFLISRSPKRRRSALALFTFACADSYVVIPTHTILALRTTSTSTQLPTRFIQLPGRDLPPPQTMTSSPLPLAIPVLLLKTRSHPHDTYEEYFSGSRSTTTSDAGVTSKVETAVVFSPEFVPVLEHRPNTENLTQLEQLLGSGRLAGRYGGMIFTSQRAVEAWADVVKRTEHTQERKNNEQDQMGESKDMGSGMVCSPLLDLTVRM